MFRLNKYDLPNSPDEDLIILIGKGNVMAFEELYERYFNKLHWYANGFLNDEAAAEDIVQEVFMKLMKTADNFNADYKVSTWIYSMTANQCKNILRNEKNRQRLLDDNLPPSIETEQSVFIDIDSKLIKAELAEWLKQLSEKEQEIYSLRFEQELSIKEIAQIMNIPEGSVKSGIFYLLKKISTPLKKLMYER